MGRKLKGRHLQEILAEGWYRVTEEPIPSELDVLDAAKEHNRSYLAIADSRPQQRRFEDSLVQLSKVEEKSNGNDVWHSGCSDVKGCPIVGKPVIEVPWQMWHTWIGLAGEFDTEWMAYLTGEVDRVTGKAQIKGMYFPPQSASGAHVEQPDEGFRAQDGTIGAVHSHVQMQAFFSGTDEDHANWPVEIVVNAKGEWKAQVRVKLECGRWSRVDAEIRLTDSPVEGAGAALKAAMKPAEHTTRSVVDSLDYQGLY